MALEKEKELLINNIKDKDKVINNILKSIRDLTSTVFYMSDPENGDGNIIVSKSAYYAYDYGEEENKAWKLMKKLEGCEVHDQIYQKGIGWEDKDGNIKCACGDMNCEKSEWKESKYRKILKNPNTTLEKKNKAVMEAYEKYGNSDCSYGSPLKLESGTMEDFWEGSEDIVDEYFSDLKPNPLLKKLIYPKRNTSNHLALELEAMNVLLDKKREYITYLKNKCIKLNDLKVYDYFNDEFGHPSDSILLTKKRNKGDKEDEDYIRMSMKYGCYSQNSFLDEYFN